MIRLVDLNYHAHLDICHPEEVLELQKASVGFVEYIREKLSIHLIKHMNYEGTRKVGQVNYSFFKSRNHFWYIPFKTHRFIRKLDPQVVLIQGLVFPLQLMALRLQLGKDVKIIVQHHGERPFRGIKKRFQRMAGRYITAYLFTSAENAGEWIERKIIPRRAICYEVLEASTGFKAMNKFQCRSSLRLSGHLNFLWVGRLENGKDPLTVLKAFEPFCSVHPQAKLFMVYQTEELLPVVRKKIGDNPRLRDAVILMGKVDHPELEKWYNAADYYISASHKEGSGYALIEAMACGCIPVVTNIPSFRKITGNGKYGFLFEPGNPESLLDILLNLENAGQDKLPESVIEHFNRHLSFQSIAEGVAGICERLTENNRITE